MHQLQNIDLRKIFRLFFQSTNTNCPNCPCFGRKPKAIQKNNCQIRIKY
ncbi:unnamed protein product [Paramecium sonneborni]|uniref:Uncharacterized protein n=1 Tax=Paramecium sonneborni TaxID=65129 RepID=A0A8S1L543_9CILI|nr:unnamed protein product [Paramecium sonneborni]